MLCWLLASDKPRGAAEMAKEINDIIAEIRRLEEQLETYVEDLRGRFRYQLHGKKVIFDQTIKGAHRRFKQGLLGYVLGAPLAHLLTAPVIYAMVMPIALFDLTITLYQHICFRAYGIPRVRRGDYVVIDRHRLGYLNALEKLNCVYCGYGNGVVAYSREIIARTEQYWCPIKHALRARGHHARYYRFAEFGDAEHYREQLIQLREDFKNKE